MLARKTSLYESLNLLSPRAVTCVCAKPNNDVESDGETERNRHVSVCACARALRLTAGVGGALSNPAQSMHRESVVKMHSARGHESSCCRACEVSEVGWVADRCADLSLLLLVHGQRRAIQHLWLGLFLVLATMSLCSVVQRSAKGIQRACVRVCVCVCVCVSV
jgi:hypothetical protein